MRRLQTILVLGSCVLVTACIPRGIAPQEAPPVSLPRLETDIDTLFNEVPIWEMRPVAANSRVINSSEYIVQHGDTLRGIGEQTGAGSEALARANAIEAPFVIRPGQRLIVPGGQYHRVSGGETGIAIARAYQVGWGEIIALNGLEEPFTLRVGQRLALPILANVRETSIEQRASAFKLDIDDILTGGEPAFDGIGVATGETGQPTRPLAPTIAVNEPSRFAGGFGWPAAGRVVGRFGPAGSGTVNDGIDIAVVQNSPVLASSDGIVAFVGDDVAGFGGVILIRHGEGWISAYGRISLASVTRGQSVLRGQHIGRAGTGASPLLNFQLRQKRTPVDPLKHLPARG